MLTVTIKGLGKTQVMLQNAAAGLQGVPERVSRNEDVKRALVARGQLAMQQVDFSKPGGASYDNVKAETTPDGKGIMVFEDINEGTLAKGGPPWSGRPLGPDQYAIFFTLPEYVAFSFLKYPKEKNFLALWPELMKPVVEDAYNEEVRKAVSK